MKLQEIISFSSNELDNITSIASQICDAKVSFLNLFKGNEQHFTSIHSGDIKLYSKDILLPNLNDSTETIVIEDIRNESIYTKTTFKIDFTPIFYVIIPLIDNEKNVLGSIYVVHDSPKKIENKQIQSLEKLATLAVSLLSASKYQYEYKELQKVINQKNLLFSITASANQIGTWELDIHSGKTIWSDVVYNIHEVPFDFDHNKVKGIEFYHEDYRETISNSIQNAIENNEPFDVECIINTAKGNEKWVRATGKKVDNKLVGSFQDITKIKHNEQKFKAIFNSTFSFIGFLSVKGILLEINDTAIKMAGIKREYVINKYFWDCYWWGISKQTQEELKLNFKKAVSGESVLYEVVIWIANKVPITILFSMKPIFDDNGNVLYIIPEGIPIQEIVETRRKYKSVIEGTNAGTWEWNIQTGKTLFNERWAEMAGYSLDELNPTSIETWKKLIHPEDLKETKKQLSEYFEKKVDYYEIENRIKHKKGHWIWVHDRGKVFEWTKDGKPLMMSGTHQDITERKQKEENLRISEEAFRGNFENAAIGMALLDENGKWLKVNSKVCEITGYTESELLKLTFQDITHHDDLEKDLILLQELIKGERNHYQMEKRYFHKNGHIIYIILAVSMVKDSEGNIDHFISQIIDVSKLKNVEIQLKTTLSENNALMDATTEIAFFSTNSKGIIEKVNIGAEKILGYDNQTTNGKNIQKLLFLKNEWDNVSKEMLKNTSNKKGDKFEIFNLFANKEVFRAKEFTFKRKNGTVLPVLLSVTEIILKNKSKKYLFAATDISQIKSIQSQLEQKNAELEQFAYVAAHDLKEPLRGITTYLSVLQKNYSDQLEEKAKSYIENAYDNATRMKSLINNILDFSQTGAIREEPVNLNDLLNSIFERYQKSKLITLYKSELPILKGDTSSFIQLFTNLIDNAIKYQPTDNSPKIEINVEEDEDSWLFNITDNGIGIKPEHRDKVFEIFKRLHSNSEYKGTGIGLATCKKIISAYGGKIWIESNYPTGTIFKFTIPKN